MDVRIKKLIAGATAFAVVATQALTGVVYGVGYQINFLEVQQLSYLLYLEKMY